MDTTMNRASSRERLVVALAYVATALLTLIPFFQVGFTTCDDLLYFQVARHSWADWMGDARIYAETQGRFYFLITKIFYYVPYLVDNFAYTKAVQYLSLVACYGLAAYFVYRLFRSWQLGLMVLLLLLLDTAITSNNHIATIAYPFYFSFSLILFIGALLLFLNYRERGAYWRIIVSALLMLATFLFYEMYLLFAVAFLVVITIGHWRSRGLRATLRSRAFWSEVLPYLFVAALYAGCYFGYRLWLTNTHKGSAFYAGATFTADSFTLDGFFRVLWRCTRGVLPWQYYMDSQSLMRDNSLLIGGHTNNLWRVLTHAPVIVWINALLQAALLWWLTRSVASSLSRRHLLWGFLAALFLAFFAHALIGITPKYNVEWSHWMRGYVTSFFSMFALMTAFALLIAGSLRLFRSEGAQRFVRLGWCLFILLLSVLTGYSNHHVGREWAKSQHRFALIDRMSKAGAFDTLPDNAVLYIEELAQTSWVANDISKGPELGKYINMRAGRSFHFASTIDELVQMPANAPVYYLHAAQSQKAGDLLVAIAALDAQTPLRPDSLTASHVESYYYSPSKQYTLFYQAAGTWKALPFAAERHIERITHIALSDSAINPRSLLISNMILPQQDDE